MRCSLVTVSQDASLDKFSNNWSLFHLIEQFQVSEFPAILPFSTLVWLDVPAEELNLDYELQVIVRPDGVFSFPLAGSIQTSGKSVEEIEVIVTERLERFIPDPVVTVATEKISGNDIYVIGQVNRPGQFSPVARIDVTQALSLAGGTSPFANVSNIKILRRIDGNLIAIPFDYGDVEKGKRLNQNISTANHVWHSLPETDMAVEQTGFDPTLQRKDLG